MLGLVHRRPQQRAILVTDRMKRFASYVYLLTILSACGGDTTAEFGQPVQVPKAKRPLVWDATPGQRLGLSELGPAKAGAKRTSASTKVVANLPNGWEELPPAPSRFRNAVWRIKGEPTTDIYLTIGVGGGVPGNLRRWYVNQFGKSTAPDAEALPPIDLANRPGRLVDIEGTFAGKPDWAALIAFYNEGSAVTSLKFTGPKRIVSANKKEFLMLAKSIRFTAEGSNQAAPPIRPGQAMPEGHVAVPSSNSGAGPAAAPFTAKAPADWTAKSGRRMLNHTFGSGSEVYVSQLGGTVRQSFDIWRSEMGLESMTDDEFDALPNTLFLGEDALLMDLTGSFHGMTGSQIKDARLLVAARSDGTSITFCKLVGPRSEVDSQHDAFVQFCGSVRRAK